MLSDSQFPMIVRLTALTLLMATHTALAGTYYVSPSGNDDNPGSKSQPFKAIQKAADTVAAGDTCVIQAGTYREAVVLSTSGSQDKPIRFVVEDDRAVLLDGTEPVSGTWTKHKGDIYVTPVDVPVEQLFVGRRMMVEARWPNMDFETQLFDRKAWASTVKGSQYGQIKDPALAKTGIDWTGAHLTLNGAHQFFTWTRTVSQHGKGNDTLTYPKDLTGVTRYANGPKGWDDDYYFLSGKLEALDTPTEWFYDADKKLLYFFAPGGKDPSTLDVRYRARQIAMSGSNLKHVELVGIDFFACSFNFKGSSDMVVDRCWLRFPTYSRHVRSPLDQGHWTGIKGNNNVIRNCAVSYSSHSGLKLIGDHNIVEDCFVHDVCWHGSLGYAGLTTTGEGSILRRNTVYNGGNALVVAAGGNQRVEYNHVCDGGLLCRDVSLIYTQLPRCRGTVIHHNWVHGCRTEGFSQRGLGGMGIRGDDQTRRLTVHHNVVWDCGIHGIVVKGDENRVFNNTVFDVGPVDLAKRNDANSKHLLIPTRAEPRKPWREQFPLLKVQNANSLYYNNLVGNLVWRGAPLKDDDKISHNLLLKKMNAKAWLVDPDGFDFRPRKGSPLIDAGRIVPDAESTYEGKAPDVGAYEYGAEPWTAGITWDPTHVLRDEPSGDE